MAHLLDTRSSIERPASDQARPRGFGLPLGALALLMLVLGACSHGSGVARAPRPDRDDEAREGTRRRGVQVGQASYYAPSFEGELTASGERYHQKRMTCAHRTLPFGLPVRVTNLENGRSTVVVVNDRGPFVRGRVVDLSMAAARRLGLLEDGLAPVRVEVLPCEEAARAGSRLPCPEQEFELGRR